MSKHDQRQTYNGPNPDGFGFVDVVGDEFKGFINLFWKDQVLALLPPPIATEIRAAIAIGAAPSATAIASTGFRWRHKSAAQDAEWNYVYHRAPDSFELRECEIQPIVALNDATLAQQPQEATSTFDHRQTVAYGVKGNRFMVKATRGEIHHPYTDKQIIELVDRAAPAPAADCAKLLSLLSRVTNELKQLNANARDEIDDDMADPEGETEFCDAVADLIEDAENALAAHGQPVND